MLCDLLLQPSAPGCPGPGGDAQVDMTTRAPRALKLVSRTENSPRNDGVRCVCCVRFLGLLSGVRWCWSKRWFVWIFEESKILGNIRQTSLIIDNYCIWLWRIKTQGSLGQLHRTGATGESLWIPLVPGFLDVIGHDLSGQLSMRRSWERGRPKDPKRCTKVAVYFLEFLESWSD